MAVRQKLKDMIAWFKGRLPKKRSPVSAGRRSYSSLKPDRPEPEPEVELPLLADRYRVHNVIGRGGMAKVWKAYDTKGDRWVAIKQMVPPPGGWEAAARNLFIREARTLFGLTHRNIVRIIALLDEPEGIHMVFEFVSGKPMQQLMAEKKRLSWGYARDTLCCVVDALIFAHDKGVVHRDVKPPNIMITPEGLVKVMDFGIARATGAPPEGVPGTEEHKAPDGMPIARTPNVAGTPGYQSPEAFHGIVSPAADIYSVGACLYEFVTGQLPFGPKGWSRKRMGKFMPASQRVPGLPQGVDGLIARCLAPDYRKRLQSAKELRAALDTI